MENITDCSYWCFQDDKNYVSQLDNIILMTNQQNNLQNKIESQSLSL